MTFSATAANKQMAVICIALVVAGAILVVSINRNTAERDQGSRGPTRLGNFIWKFDCSEGLAVTYPLRLKDCERLAANGSVKVIAQVSDELDNDWEILEARGFISDGTERLRALFEGPYPYGDSNSTKTPCSGQREWQMIKLKPKPYEIDLLLHRKTNRLSFKETIVAIRDRAGVNFRIESQKDL